MTLTITQLEERINRLEDWVDTHRESHYMYSAIDKELRDYLHEMAIVVKSGALEYESKVPTQFYGQLQMI